MLRILSLVALIAAFTNSTYAAPKTFVYCTEGSPSGFNPLLTEDGTSITATKPIYQELVTFKDGTTTIIPQLAESWKVSKDGLTYTFKLRKGVKWHKTSYFTPTREFNADDVLFSFNRQMNKDHPLHKQGQYIYWDAMAMGDILKEVKKSDPYTVNFILKKKEAPFIANMAMWFATVNSEEYGQAMIKAGTPGKVDTDPVGTGPYIFVRYDKDQSIRYEANPEYWGGKPKIDKLVYQITPDASVRFQKLKTGECNLIAPAPADLDAIRADKNLVLAEKPGLNTGYVALNMSKKPFDNVLVRQAVNHALNKKAYMEAIYLNNAMIAKNVIPPTIWSYNDSVKDYDYNPEKAKELLKKAGLENGFETELWTLPVSRPYNPNGKKMGEMMQADLAKVGIKVKLVTYDWPTYLKKRKEGEHTMIQIGWQGDNGDPDNFFYYLLACSAIKGGTNEAHYCNKEFDKAISDAKLTSDQNARTKLYKKAQEIFKKDAPWVTVAHAKMFRAMTKNVDGFVVDVFSVDNLERVSLK